MPDVATRNWGFKVTRARSKPLVASLAGPSPRLCEMKPTTKPTSEGVALTWNFFHPHLVHSIDAWGNQSRLGRSAPRRHDPQTDRFRSPPSKSAHTGLRHSIHTPPCLARRRGSCSCSGRPRPSASRAPWPSCPPAACSRGERYVCDAIDRGRLGAWRRLRGLDRRTVGSVGSVGSVVPTPQLFHLTHARPPQPSTYVCVHTARAERAPNDGEARPDRL